MIFGQILLAVLAVSLISLVGIITIGLKMNPQKITFYLISLVSGTMVGGALIHLIPEAMEAQSPHMFMSISLGVFIFFVLEKLLIWRHCHHHQNPHDHKRPVAAAMVITGDAVHNFIDGVIIASAFLAGPTIGFSITLAILLHEIPQELGDFGILIHGGYTTRQALTANLLTATSSFAGAIITYFFLNTSALVHFYVLPVAAGGFLYIALADLIPQLHEQVSFRQTIEQIILVAVGFLMMVLLKHHAV